MKKSSGPHVFSPEPEEDHTYCNKKLGDYFLIGYTWSKQILNIEDICKRHGWKKTEIDDPYSTQENLEYRIIFLDAGLKEYFRKEGIPTSPQDCYAKYKKEAKELDTLFRRHNPHLTRYIVNPPPIIKVNDNLFNNEYVKNYMREGKDHFLAGIICQICPIKKIISHTEYEYGEPSSDGIYRLIEYFYQDSLKIMDGSLETEIKDYWESECAHWLLAEMVFGYTIIPEEKFLMPRDSYIDSLKKIGELAHYWITHKKVTRPFMHSLNKTGTTLPEPRKNPLTMLVYSFFDSLIDDIVSDRLLKRCANCNQCFILNKTNFDKHLYCNKKCRKSAESKRFYRRHRNKLLKQKRKDIKERRKFYREKGIEKLGVRVEK